MARNDYLDRILNEFVFVDTPLGDHPKVGAAIFMVVEKNKLLFAITHTSEKITRVYPESFSNVQGIVGHVLREGRYFIAEEISTDESYYPPWLGADYKSEIAVPLIDGEDIIGVLSVSSTEANYFSNRQLGLVQLLSAIILYSLNSSKLISPASISLGKALRDVRHELGLTQVELADSMGRSRIALSRWESGAQPPSMGVIYDWCRALGLFSDRGRTFTRSIDITPRLPDILKIDAQTLGQLSPSQFEQFVAERLDRMGFDVSLAGSTSFRDGGIDLIAIPKTRTVGSFLLAGQVKHHRGEQKTGREAVDRLLAWKDGGFHMGLLVTNTTFTKDARWIAAQGQNQQFMRLRDLEDIKRWIDDNFSSPEDWREIPDKIELAPGVIIEIPKPRLSNSLDIWPLSKLKQYKQSRKDG